MAPLPTSHAAAARTPQPAEWDPAEVDAIAATFREALAADAAAPTVTQVREALAAVEGGCGALLGRLRRLGDLSDDSALAGLELDLQGVQRRAAAAALQGRGTYRPSRLPPKTELCIGCLSLWRRHHPDPPTAYEGSGFHRFCASVYSHATGECADAEGVGLIAHVKAAIRHGKITGEYLPVRFLNTAAADATLA